VREEFPNLPYMRHIIRMAAIYLLAATAKPVVAQVSRIDIRKFGAAGDGRRMNTLAIQRAIDRVAGAGGGVVEVGPGRWLTGVLTLKSGVELHLEAGAVLVGSERRADYGGERASALLVAEGQTKIGITGSGTIDGRGREVAADVIRMIEAGQLKDPDWPRENAWHQKRSNESNRPGIIQFKHCTDVRVDSVLLKDAACWVQTYTECVQLKLEHVRVESNAYWNNDGIDVVDCQDVLIRGCQINADDDGICLKSSNKDKRCEQVVIEDCTVRSSASGIKFGTASHGGFRHIEIRRVKIYDTYRSAIALESVDGGILEDVRVEDVVANNTGNALFVRLGHRNQQSPPGSIRDVVIKGLRVEIPAGKPDKGYEMEGPVVDLAHNFFPASIVGIPGHPVEGIRLEDVEIDYKGAEDRAVAHVGFDSVGRVPERESDYPEFSMFGELPAWGLYVRHVNGLELRHVVLRREQGGFRPAMVFDDVQRLSIDQ
jgi:polygalacturonase